jgi:hypothetical protein
MHSYEWNLLPFNRTNIQIVCFQMNPIKFRMVQYFASRPTEVCFYEIHISFTLFLLATCFLHKEYSFLCILVWCSYCIIKLSWPRSWSTFVAGWFSVAHDGWGHSTLVSWWSLAQECVTSWRSNTADELHHVLGQLLVPWWRFYVRVGT